MPAERVVDASVMAAAFFEEALSDEARRFVLAMPRLIAPDHLHIEIASVAAKKLWRGETTAEIGARACAAVASFVDTRPSPPLTLRAFELAARHHISAYDALYLALAESRNAPVFTFDADFARRAGAAGFAGLVEAPPALLG